MATFGFRIKKPRKIFNAGNPNVIKFATDIYLSDMKYMKSGESDCRYEIIVNYYEPNKPDDSIELIIKRADRVEVRKKISVRYVNDTIIQVHMLREFGIYISKILPKQDIIIEN